MRKWFGRSHRSLSDSVLDDQLLGEKTLLELASTKGLGASIEKHLRSSEDWPFDLGDGTINKQEQAVLNLWGFVAGVLHCIHVETDTDRRALLNRFHLFFFACLTDVGLTRFEGRRFNMLAAERYPEYEDAFRGLYRDLAAHSPAPGLSFFQAVAWHLFGHKTDGISVHLVIITCILNYFEVFAATFDNQEDWSAMQSTLEGWRNRTSGS
jgi:hypothetical protein